MQNFHKTEHDWPDFKQVQNDLKPAWGRWKGIHTKMKCAKYAYHLSSLEQIATLLVDRDYKGHNLLQRWEMSLPILNDNPPLDLVLCILQVRGSSANEANHTTLVFNYKEINWHSFISGWTTKHILAKPTGILPKVSLSNFWVQSYSFVSVLKIPPASHLSSWHQLKINAETTFCSTPANESGTKECKVWFGEFFKPNVSLLDKWMKARGLQTTTENLQ